MTAGNAIRKLVAAHAQGDAQQFRSTLGEYRLQEMSIRWKDGDNFREVIEEIRLKLRKAECQDVLSLCEEQCIERSQLAALIEVESLIDHEARVTSTR